MWYCTHCLKIMLVIDQKWWHEIAHAVSFFSEKALLFFYPRRKKGKSIMRKTCTGRGESAVWQVNQLRAQFWYRSYFLLSANTVKKTETQHPSTSDHLLVTYECCILAHNWTDLWGILLLSRNCHAGQHQNEGTHHCWIAHRGFWSQTTSTSVVFQQGGHTGAKGRRAAWSEGGTHTGSQLK